MSMNLETGLELILKAMENDRDERLFQQWIAQLPVMALSGQPVSFQDYRDKLTGANIDNRPANEIMAELDEVEKQFNREGGEPRGT